MTDINNKHVRFHESGFYKFVTGKKVVLGGVGGIGSWLALFLARMGVELYLFETDTVDTTNLGGQLYGESSVGEEKAVAIVDLLTNLVGKEYAEKITSLGRYIESSPTTKVMFSAFDNMTARKHMFTNWKEMMLKADDKKEFIFIDGRMRIEYFEVLAVTHENYEYYEKHYIFPEEDADDGACSAKATSHFGAATAWAMTTAFTNYFSEERVIPFSTEVFGPLFDIKTKEVRRKNGK